MSNGIGKVGVSSQSSLCQSSIVLLAFVSLNDVSGWYGIYPRSIRRRTEGNKHRDGTHLEAAYLVPGRADNGTRLQYRQCCRGTCTEVNARFSCVYWPTQVFE